MSTLLAPLLPYVKPAAGWLAKQAAARGWKIVLRYRLEKKIAKAIESALVELFRRLPALAREDAIVELGPLLEKELKKLPTATEQPDPEAIGRVLCHGAPVATPPPRDVGDLLLGILLEHLLALEDLQPILTTRLVFQISLRVKHLEDAFTGARGLVAMADSAPPLSPPQRAQAEAAISASAPTLLNWPQVLPSGEWLERPELAQLRARVEMEDHSVSVVLGGPGSGKSALLARLGNQLREGGGATVIGIKADQLPTDMNDEWKLAESQGLEGHFSDLMRRLAKDGRVVVLVDQMDAVADIVDLTSRRLSVLLDTIADLAGTPNLHIIASSRNFEYRHDPRFGRIEAQAIQLEAPAWDQVAPILTRAGVDTTHWPVDRKNAMRAPQVLSTFLALVGDLGGPDVVQASYHGMLDQVWAARLSDPSVRGFVAELAHQMATDESLHQPLARWHHRQYEMNAALSAGVLLLSHDGLRLSFRHQTLFDHAVAHAFVQVGNSISRYVVEHQDALFTRPRIWSVLTYMRDAAPDQYARELDTMWSVQGLRLHLRYLLLEFLGAQEAPTAQEVALLLPCLDDPELVMKAARAIAGNAAWFSVVQDHRLPEMMCAEGRHLDAAALLARRALPFASAHVFHLVDRHWCGDTGAPLRYHVLDAVECWDDEAVRLAWHLVTSNRIGDGGICRLAAQMGVSRPDDAARLCLERLKWRTELLDDKVEDLFRGHEWIELAAISRAAPRIFLKEGLPWFLDLMDRYAWPQFSGQKEFRHSKIYASFTNDGDRLHENDIVAAIYAALLALAETDVDEFLALSAPMRGSDVDLVHRILARALESVAQVRASAVVNYLLADGRHLRLGVDDAEHLESRRLIAAVAATCNREQIDRLFQGVIDWVPARPNWYSEDRPEGRRQWFKTVQGERVQLLRGFPLDALTAPQRQIRMAEERRCQGLPAERDSDAGRILSTITSQMSPEAMGRASDEDVIAFLHKHILKPTEADQIALRDARTFVDAFSGFSKKHSARAASIIDRMPVLGFKDLASSALFGIAEGLTCDDFVAWARQQISRGHGGSNFIERTAMAVRGHIRHPTGLPDDLLALFADALCDAPEPQTSERSGVAEEHKPPSPLLWGVGGMSIVPQGNYSFLSAIWWGLLLRDPAESDRALEIAFDHLQHHRERLEVWRHFAAVELRHLRHCTPGLATQFIDALFARIPAIGATREMTMMVAHTWVWAPVEAYLRWADSIRRSGWDRGDQAYGELVALRHLLEPEDPRLREEIAILLAGPNHGAQTGLAFAATNLWKEPKTRVDAADLLARLAAIEHPDVSTAVLDAFRTAHPLPRDSQSRALLDAVARSGALERATPSYFLIQALADVVSVWPEEVASAVTSIVRALGTTLGDVRTHWASDAHDLVTISLALQRLGGRWRIEGLNIFEALLQAEAFGVDDALADLEGPRGNNLTARPLRLRRRRSQLVGKAQ